ncbi:MAG: hypothetical protein SWQ30_06805 [Thermodesulfobacteriota bacterium]|nr:hypothetical protein [Thermodesulfobacteriota bacterium]
MGNWSTELIEGMDLPSLYRLRRQCTDTRDHLSLLGYRFREEAPSLEDVEAIFGPLTRSFPELVGPLGTQQIAAELYRAYSAEETERLEKDLEGVSGFSERGKVIDRIFLRQKDTVNSVSAKLIQIARAAQDRIESGEWDPLRKAEGFLEHFICCSEECSFGDQEALIYLRSRGVKCDGRIRELIQDWRGRADETIRNFARGHEFRFEADGKTERFGERPLEEAADVEQWSAYLLRDFWGAHDDEELIIDATMLRTVEWCEIGGFEVWWKRWADHTADLVAHAGVEQGPAVALWLFSLCRSDFAIRLVGNTLGTALWGLQLGKEQKQKPWILLDLSGESASEQQCPMIAASILFCAARLGRALCDPTVLASAEDFLPATQLSDGSWPHLCSHNRGSIETTAVVVHALAMVRPRGWNHAVASAASWLLRQQDPFGCWTERLAAGSSAFQTVLVLDALELAAGGRAVSFNAQRCHDVGRDDSQRRALQNTKVEPARGSMIMTNIYKKETHIHGSQVGVVGDVTADIISESFNQAMKSNENEALTSLLSELKNFTEALAKELSPSEAQTAARDFADVAQESTSPNPRRKRLKVTAEGLIEAARKCSRLVKPITATVQAILALFPQPGN